MAVLVPSCLVLGCVSASQFAMKFSGLNQLDFIPGMRGILGLCWNQRSFLLMWQKTKGTSGLILILLLCHITLVATKPRPWLAMWCPDNRNLTMPMAGQEEMPWLQSWPWRMHGHGKSHAWHGGHCWVTLPCLPFPPSLPLGTWRLGTTRLIITTNQFWHWHWCKERRITYSPMS